MGNLNPTCIAVVSGWDKQRATEKVQMYLPIIFPLATYGNYYQLARELILRIRLRWYSRVSGARRGSFSRQQDCLRVTYFLMPALGIYLGEKLLNQEYRD